MSLRYPDLPQSPTRAHFARLLWRAGFSAAPAELDRWVAIGLDAAVERLLHPARPAVLEGPAPTVGGQPIDPLDLYGHDALWWLDRMVRSANQLEERMTLNLHDHFATSTRGVGNTRHMLRQNRLLRASAFGSFPTLVRTLTHDPAMLVWLNGAESKRGAPNENYARELMELFCLGNDTTLETTTHGLWRASRCYTQADVHNAARALTGWRYDWAQARSGTAAQREYPVRYDRSWHDGGVKHLFGKRGRFDWRDVCRLVVAHPNHAPFLAAKLWSYFVPTPPPVDAMHLMVANYRATGGALRPLLRVILRHADLYADLDAPPMVKPPAVYLAGALRMLGRPIDTDVWWWLLQGMGQQLFYPPNVAGWDQGTAWFNTSTVRMRFQVWNQLLPPLATLADPGAESPDAAVDGALTALGGPWISDSGRAALAAYSQTFEARYARGGALSVSDRTGRRRVLMALAGGGPDAQLH